MMDQEELKALRKRVLIDRVLEQIKTDIENGDLTAIAELLKSVPERDLVGYLPEELVK